MDIEIFRTFLEVERLRHFGHAADELFVTQAAVSSRIRLLEETLGVRLFERKPRQVDLTPEGHRFKRYAERMVVEWRKARHDVGIGRDGMQLSVGATWRVWNAGLEEWLHDIYRHFHNIALIVESHTPETLVRRLLDGQLDVGFMLEPPQIESLEITEVAELQLMLFSPTQGVSVDDALSEGYVHVDWGFSHALQHRRLHPDAQEPRLRFSEADIALDFLLEFGGAAYLSTRMVADEVREGVLFPVRGAEAIPRSVYAIHAVRGYKREMITEALEKFRYTVALPRRRRQRPSAD